MTPKFAIPIDDFEVPYAAPTFANTRAEATPMYAKNVAYDYGAPKNKYVNKIDSLKNYNLIFYLPVAPTSA